MAIQVRVKLNLPKAQEVVNRLGFGRDGAVQNFHTMNVMRRMARYMPMDSGAFIKNTYAHVNLPAATITSVGPMAAYLYYGKVMVDSETGKGPAFIPNVGFRFRKGSTLTATNRDLNYSRSKNPLAGAFWDRRLVANESDKLVHELQDFIKRGG